MKYIRKKVSPEMHRQPFQSLESGLRIRMRLDPEVYKNHGSVSCKRPIL